MAHPFHTLSPNCYIPSIRRFFFLAHIVGRRTYIEIQACLTNAIGYPHANTQGYKLIDVCCLSLARKLPLWMFQASVRLLSHTICWNRQEK